ncbi:hypothetical protein CCMA1212_002630 [Trichoderma ghanense]|uniref:Uncharacterized protein n=1 Tax=Trichoderma ghanense TaxID=65468 RepID=A0ABY2H9R5_9HYPO
MASSYPSTIPLESGKNRPIRGPYSNVTKVVHDPQLDSLSRDGEWRPVPEESEPTAKASGAPSVQNGLSQQSIQDITVVSTGSASQEHDTALATRDPASSGGKSDSSSGSSCLPTEDKASDGTANHVHVDHDVSHMAPWVKDSLDVLRKQ